MLREVRSDWMLITNGRGTCMVARQGRIAPAALAGACPVNFVPSTRLPSGICKNSAAVRRSTAPPHKRSGNSCRRTMGCTPALARQPWKSHEAGGAAQSPPEQHLR
mmetsp:Transcript_29703/g.47702  ORF Transcript_29703/g.47702 Transcript_29703/m.47702 type:complete len:106 (-) Transcript_29703:479-796(-)